MRAVHSHKTLEMWLFRFIALLRIRMVDVLLTELDGFGDFDKPDLFFEFYPDTYPGRRGSMVPFLMRLIHAEASHYAGRSLTSLDRLYALLRVCESMLNGAAAAAPAGKADADHRGRERQLVRSIWAARIRHIRFALANVLVQTGDFDSALTLLEAILAGDDRARRAPLLAAMARVHLTVGARKAVPMPRPRVRVARSPRPRVRNSDGRVALAQMGNLRAGQELMAQAESLCVSPDASVDVHVGRGLLAVANGLYARAADHFGAAIALEPRHAVAISNRAVCFLYMGRLHAAIALLEAALYGTIGPIASPAGAPATEASTETAAAESVRATDPTTPAADGTAYTSVDPLLQQMTVGPVELSEAIIGNLCLLYDMLSNRGQLRKRQLLEWLAGKAGDGFDADVLKFRPVSGYTAR